MYSSRLILSILVTTKVISLHLPIMQAVIASFSMFSCALAPSTRSTSAMTQMDVHCRMLWGKERRGEESGGAQQHRGHRTRS